jgi:SEC-C motif-containing protein
MIKGEVPAPTPEALMRSRYSAYASLNLDYLDQTTDPQALGEIDNKANKEWANTAEFLDLQIVTATDSGNKGTVEFKTNFKIKGDETVHTHHELSTFRKQGGRWYFRKGRVVEVVPKK